MLKSKLIYIYILSINWLRPPTGLCAGGKQTVGYMQGVVNRLRPHHHPPPPTTPNRPLLNNRWLLVALTGPWPKWCIVHRYCCHFYRRQGAPCVVSYHRARDRGKVLLSAPKLPQFKGAAAKTGVPPEGNILLFKVQLRRLTPREGRFIP